MELPVYHIQEQRHGITRWFCSKYGVSEFLLEGFTSRLSFLEVKGNGMEGKGGLMHLYLSHLSNGGNPSLLAQPAVVIVFARFVF